MLGTAPLQQGASLCFPENLSSCHQAVGYFVFDTSLFSPAGECTAGWCSPGTLSFTGRVEGAGVLRGAGGGRATLESVPAP